jgi:oxygen-dependent protoporphyrinogen oxidase
MVAPAAPRVVVVGGGIAGLAAAFTLGARLPDAEIVVLEAADRVGGKLRTGSVGGIDVDLGAEAMLARRPEGIDLVRAAGLDERIIAPSTTSAAIRSAGVAHPLPARTMLGIPADIDALRASGAVSVAAVERAASEPAAEPIPPLTEDVAVGALVRSRLGSEVVDNLVEPLLGGVYAGRADDLSLRATMPALAAALSGGGSLVAAARSVVDVGSHDASAGPVFASLAGGGLGTLPAALAGRGRFTVRTATVVRSLARTSRGFALTCGATPAVEVVDADAVVVATPAAKAAQLLRDVSPAAAAELTGIDSASMAVVTLAFPDIALPAGSGLLVGTREGFAVKAITLSSQKWPMATGGLVLLRASVGRAGETRDLQRSDEELVAMARHELAALIGVTAAPVDNAVTRWGGGLPQYAVGHVERVERIRAAVAEVAGLAVCGASYDGVGIPACIASAHRAADQIAARLAAPAGARGE